MCMGSVAVKGLADAGTSSSNHNKNASSSICICRHAPCAASRASSSRATPGTAWLQKLMRS